jgi:SH3 domain-containing YSC84-like protein 1
MRTLKLFCIPLLLSVFILCASATDAGVETERVHAATDVIKEFTGIKASIPHQLLEQYNGIVIIPHLLNAGFVVGGKRGRGVAMVKLDDGTWSDPVFVTLTGGSFGLQIGVQSVDLVLVFHHRGVLTQVKNGDFTIGGDISAAAGPVGRSGTASTDYALRAEVYSYSRSRGLFAGISINGADLAIDKSADANFYGNSMSSQDIFMSGKNNSEAVLHLKEALAKL